MAENKKSFVLYTDLIKSIDHLTFEEKGMLFSHILEYVNDLNPVLTDRVLISVWKPIELQLKRDLIKYNDVKAKRSEAGKISAELRQLRSSEQNSTNPTSVESVEHNTTNPTVNDNVNDNDIIIKNKQHATVCLASDIWKESVAMKSKVPIDKLHLAMDEFLNHLNTIGETKQTLKDFKYHFASWVLKMKNLKN